MVKMRAESLAELVHLAHEAGLGQSPSGADFLPPAGASLPGHLGPRADLPLGASEVFTDPSPEHRLRRRGGDVGAIESTTVLAIQRIELILTLRDRLAEPTAG